MAAGESIENVIRDAELYFEKHQIRPLLTDLIVELAQNQPSDPIAALLCFLSKRCTKPQAAEPLPGVGQADAAISGGATAEAPASAEVPGQTLPKAQPEALPQAALQAPSQVPVEVVPETKLSSAPVPGSAAEPTDIEECDQEDAPPQADPLRILLQEHLPSPESLRTAAPMAEPGLSSRRCWAGGFNRALLEGWVKQPSPCCAAASVAGAFNALWDLGDGSEGRCTVRECADLMAEHCDALRTQRQQRVERLLGVAEGSLGEFLFVLDEHLEASGFQWTARAGPKAVTKQVAMAAVREVLNGDQLEPQATEAGLSQSVFEALREVLGVMPEGDGGGSAAEEDAEAAPEEHVGGVVLSVGTDWKKELQELLTKRKGVMRLRAEKPNTGEIGSWGVKQAVESLALSRSTDPVRVSCLMGRKNCMKNLAWAVAKSDSEDVIDQQWAALKAAFSKPHVALIFHLTNHYALIFSWREWLDDENGQEPRRRRPRRQLLTARRGQRPTAWLDFAEVRSIMIGWSGYHILQVERLADQGSDSP